MLRSRSTSTALSPSMMAAPASTRAQAGPGGHRSEEWVIVDKSGRLQLPPPLVEKLGLIGRARVHVADDHLQIWPDKKEEQR